MLRLKPLPKNVPTQTYFYSARLIHSSIHSALPGIMPMKNAKMNKTFSVLRELIA